MGHHDAFCQCHLAEPQESLSRYLLVSTYQVQYCIAVVTVVSELALDLQMLNTMIISTDVLM